MAENGPCHRHQKGTGDLSLGQKTIEGNFIHLKNLLMNCLRRDKEGDFLTSKICVWHESRIPRCVEDKFNPSTMHNQEVLQLLIQLLFSQLCRSSKAHTEKRMSNLSAVLYDPQDTLSQRKTILHNFGSLMYQLMVCLREAVAQKKTGRSNSLEEAQKMTDEAQKKILDEARKMTGVSNFEEDFNQSTTNYQCELECLISALLSELPRSA